MHGNTRARVNFFHHSKGSREVRPPRQPELKDQMPSQSAMSGGDKSSTPKLYPLWGSRGRWGKDAIPNTGASG